MNETKLCCDNTGKGYTIYGQFNCKTVVYAINCTRIYIEQTGDTISTDAVKLFKNTKTKTENRPNLFIKHNHLLKNLKVTALKRVFRTKFYRKVRKPFE